MKVACLQMTSSTVLANNLATAQKLIQKAVDQGAELVVLPEYFCLITDSDAARLNIAEDPYSGPIQDFLSQEAKEKQIYLVAGSMPFKGMDSQKCSNTSVVYNPEGKRIARYDKIHLFRFNNGKESYDESATMESGLTPTWFDLPSKDGHTWRIALSICYDLRFPELYRRYSQEGAHIILVPAAFTYTTGQAHWEILLRARAIENLAFVGACGQVGLHDNGRRTWGQTMWIDPWGKILSEQRSAPSVVSAELNFQLLTTCRTQLPALDHRVL